jgi:hypothetical protein
MNNVKVKLGKQLSHYDNLISVAEGKVNELTHLVGEYEEEKRSLIDENTRLKKNLGIMEIDFNKMTLELEKMVLELAKEKQEKREIHSKLEEYSIQKKELLQVNKKIHLEYDLLINQVSNENQTIFKYRQEVDESEKIRSKYENKIIELSKTCDELQEKISVYENVLKQKEKYINIILRKKPLPEGTLMVHGICDTLNTMETIKLNTDVKEINSNLKKQSSLQTTSKKQNSSNNITQISNNIVLINKISALEKTITEKDSQIKKLEIEKNNLLTRIRNK